MTIGESHSSGAAILTGPGPGCAETPERLGYDAYPEFLAADGHNLIRLWRWEQFRSQAAGGDFHLCMTPPALAPNRPGDGDALWAWKSFLRPPSDPDGLRDHRGRQPIGPVGGWADDVCRLRASPLRDGRHAPLRQPDGPAPDTAPWRAQLDRLRLASPGAEYLVLQPAATANPFTVRLQAGTYTVEWFGIDSRQTMGAGEVTVEVDERFDFTPPLAEPEPVALCLRRAAR